MLNVKKGGVPKWLRERSAKPRCGGSNPPAASNNPSTFLAIAKPLLSPGPHKSAVAPTVLIQAFQRLSPGFVDRHGLKLERFRLPYGNKPPSRSRSSQRSAITWARAPKALMGPNCQCSRPFQKIPSVRGARKPRFFEGIRAGSTEKRRSQKKAKTALQTPLY